jgi:TPR repeat protein
MYTKAVKLFQKAANQGNVKAQYNLAIMLAIMYGKGLGVKQSYTKAEEKLSSSISIPTSISV